MRTPMTTHSAHLTKGELGRTLTTIYMHCGPLARDIPGLLAAVAYTYEVDMGGSEYTSISFPSGRLTLVLPYLVAGTLRPLDQPAPADALEGALRRLVGLAYALTLLHERGVVHRDIKLANVLLHSRGGALLTDFDLTVVHSYPGRAAPNWVAATMGTPGYMPPRARFHLDEFAYKYGHDAALLDGYDQWALAGTVWRMLTGSVGPFWGKARDPPRPPPRPPRAADAESSSEDTYWEPGGPVADADTLDFEALRREVVRSVQGFPSPAMRTALVRAGNLVLEGVRHDRPPSMRALHAALSSGLPGRPVAPPPDFRWTDTDNVLARVPARHLTTLERALGVIRRTVERVAATEAAAAAGAEMPRSDHLARLAVVSLSLTLAALCTLRTGKADNRDVYACMFVALALEGSNESQGMRFFRYLESDLYAAYAGMAPDAELWRMSDVVARGFREVVGALGERFDCNVFPLHTLSMFTWPRYRVAEAAALAADATAPAAPSASAAAARTRARRAALEDALYTPATLRALDALLMRAPLSAIVALHAAVDAIPSGTRDYTEAVARAVTLA